MRFFKITVSILLLIVLIVVLAIGSLVLFVDPNKLTPVLVKEAKKAGYDLRIDGKLSWSFSPRIGIEVPHMTVQESQQTSPFLDVRDLRVATELARLWHRKRSIQGYIYIGQLRLAKLQTQNISTLVTWENKTLTLAKIQGDLYNGNVSGVFHLNESANPPKWDWDVTLDSIAMQALLNDLTPESKLKLSGTGHINFKGSTVGKGRDEIDKNLNGSLNFTVKEGAVRGIDLNYMVRLVDALLNKTEMPAKEAEQTDFISFSSTADIQNGVATSHDLLLLSPAFTTKGEGTFIIATKEIQLALSIKPQQNVITQWEIPLNVTGTLNKPEVRLDKEAIAKFIAGEQFQKVKEKAADFVGNLLNKK